jgi:hypothetical protein
MSNTATVGVSEVQTATPLIVESKRGPCLAGRERLTIYPIYEYFLENESREVIQRDFGLTAEQYEAVVNYIAEHKEKVESAYARIARRSEELRMRYEPVSRALSPFTPEMTNAEKDALLRQKLALKLETSRHENNDSA